MGYNQPVADTSLIACLHCDLLQRIPELEPGASARCPRCAKEIWRRREDSLNRTLALTLGAAVLYVVANSVPMLGLTIVGRDASTTVIGGALHLWDNEQKIVGALVLFTAVIAPALQIGLIEFIGRWSMVDVFVDTFTAALIQSQPLMSVEPGPGLIFFAAVVVFTTLAVESFDPRLIWDSVISKESGSREVSYA
jgi:paraquat-inducible protein A